MGFPQRNAEGQSAAVYVSAAARLAAGGYTCPRCKVWRGVCGGGAYFEVFFLHPLTIRPPTLLVPTPSPFPVGTRRGAAMRVPRLPPDAHLLATPGTVCGELMIGACTVHLQLPVLHASFVYVVPTCMCVQADIIPFLLAVRTTTCSPSLPLRSSRRRRCSHALSLAAAPHRRPPAEEETARSRPCRATAGEHPRPRRGQQGTGRGAWGRGRQQGGGSCCAALGVCGI